MKKCPFCAEEIQDEAVKCRFCGEMLDKAMKKTVYDTSADARAVNKGLKQKELDDFKMGCLGVIAFIFALIVGATSKSFFWGVITFVVFAALGSRWYYKE
jgi:uncharacterized membrane protein YvbJ